MLWIWKWISKLLPIIETQPMIVVLVAPVTSLSIHQVLLLLAPLQVGANLQIRALPLHRRQLTRFRNSKRWFIHYLSLKSWILILNTLVLQLATWTLPAKPHHLTSEKPWLVSFSGRSTSTWNLPARFCIRKSIKGAREDCINTNNTNSVSNRYLHEDDRHLDPRATPIVIR